MKQDNQYNSFKKSLFKIIDEFTSNINSEYGRENANFIKSVPVLEHLVYSRVSAEYLFDIIYKDIPQIKEMHETGIIYHHQTSKLGPYCVGLSSYDIALKGLRCNAMNSILSLPPKRIDTFLSQCANLICLLGQEVAGATSLNDISNVVAGYLYYLENKQDQKISDYELENNFQSFLYNINLPFRAGNSPFSNITLDFSKSSPQLQNKVVVCGGKYLDICYKDIPSEYFDRVNIAFINAMARGDGDGNPFTFPLITVNITDDFDYENPSWKYLLEKSMNFGGIYLQNYCTKPFNEEAKKINPYHEPYDLGMLYSNCCRMIFDMGELKKILYGNPFSSPSGVGGIGVITINLNRIFFISDGDYSKIEENLNNIIDLVSLALEKKREWIRSKWKIMYPYLSFYLPSPDHLFSIISVAGAHEGLVSIGYEKGIYSREGRNLCHKVARFIRAKIEELSSKFGHPFSLEYAPIETASKVLAYMDICYCNNKQ